MLQVDNKVIHMFGHKVFRFIVVHTERRTVPLFGRVHLFNNQQEFVRSSKKKVGKTISRSRRMDQLA